MYMSAHFRPSRFTRACTRKSSSARSANLGICTSMWEPGCIRSKRSPYTFCMCGSPYAFVSWTSVSALALAWAAAASASAAPPAAAFATAAISSASAFAGLFPLGPTPWAWATTLAISSAFCVAACATLASTAASASTSAFVLASASHFALAFRFLRAPASILATFFLEPFSVASVPSLALGLAVANTFSSSPVGLLFPVSF
mmetsp:Transcript_120580/g.323730  ORF Transcript_120580/g.323730 Transcript_120580/m.323730 type:complete len:202 (+) Transcript_120580:473-1078(+)